MPQGMLYQRWLATKWQSRERRAHPDRQTQGSENSRAVEWMRSREFDAWVIANFQPSVNNAHVWNSNSPCKPRESGHPDFFQMTLPLAVHFACTGLPSVILCTENG